LRAAAMHHNRTCADLIKKRNIRCKRGNIIGLAHGMPAKFDQDGFA